MLSEKVLSYMERSSWIRKMFEEGRKLKELYGEEKVFDLTLGNPDLPAPSCVRNALKTFAEDYKPELHRYMPNAGFSFTREKMAEKISKEQGITVSPEEIVMTCGAAGGLNVVFKSILNPGEKVVFPSPFFVEYVFYVENHGGIPCPVPTKHDFSLDFEALEKAIDNKTKAILINSPNNPTGQIYTEEELETLAGLLTEKSREIGRPVFLISDEPYRNLVFDNYRVPSIFKYYPNSIVVYSFSKELSLAGERIGFIAVHPEIAEKKLLLAALIMCNRILGFVNGPALAQRLVERCAFEKVEVEIYQKRRDVLCNILEEAGLEFVKPKGGFFVFPKTPIDDLEFCKILKDELILAVPGRGFGLKNHIRLSLCVPEKVLLKMRSAFIKACKKAKNV